MQSPTSRPRRLALGAKRPQRAHSSLKQRGQARASHELLSPGRALQRETARVSGFRRSNWIAPRLAHCRARF